MPKKIHSYLVDLVLTDDGGYTVVVSALPGCISYGETAAEATAMPGKRSSCIWRIWLPTAESLSGLRYA